MKKLFPLCRFAHDPHGVLTAVCQCALVEIELFLNGGLGIAPVWLSSELCVASFADSEHRYISDPLYDTKITFGHVRSLAHREGWA
jgi:hypothetical protein